jgi:hypothetical protein
MAQTTIEIGDTVIVTGTACEADGSPNFPYQGAGADESEALADLPSGDDGDLGILTIAGPTYALAENTLGIWSAIGGAPVVVSVATFADLGDLTPEDNQLVGITAQSGLSADTIVRWDESSSVWRLVYTSCAESVWSPIDFGLGVWYDTDGITVETAEGAYLNDTTYKTSWRWSDITVSGFVPPWVYAGTIENPQFILGDDAEPDGWNKTNTAAGGTSTSVVSGNSILMTATTTGAGNTATSYGFTDASLLTGTNLYVRMMVDAAVTTTLTGSSNIAYFNIQVNDGTRNFNYATLSQGTVTVCNGSFMNSSVPNRYTAQASFEGGTTTFSEVLLEICKIGNRCMARVNGAAGMWQALSGTTAQATAGTSFSIGLLALRGSGTATATTTLRAVRYMRY